MRAIVLPENKQYDIKMKYKPNWLIFTKLAAFLSLVLFLWLIAGLLHRRRS